MVQGHSDTWEWTGTDWSRLSRVGPGGFSMSMAYDEGRQRVVLFGGKVFGGYSYASNYTYEWDRTRWTLVATLGPSPRSNHAMVYDPTRQRIVLHGGTVPYYVSSFCRHVGVRWHDVDADPGHGRAPAPVRARDHL